MTDAETQAAANLTPEPLRLDMPAPIIWTVVRWVHRAGFTVRIWLPETPAFWTILLVSGCAIICLPQLKSCGERANICSRNCSFRFVHRAGFSGICRSCSAAAIEARSRSQASVRLIQRRWLLQTSIRVLCLPRALATSRALRLHGAIGQ